MPIEFVNYTAKKLRQLKRKFDKLTYGDKLKFWDTQKGFSYTIQAWFFDDVPKNEREKPENSLSIVPINKEETRLYNEWLLNHHLKLPRFNIEKIKAKYFETISDNSRDIEFTEQEIEVIIKRREKEKRYYEERRDLMFWGYYYGYQSVVQKKDLHLTIYPDTFYRICSRYAAGIAEAHYLGFLETQLKLLEQKKKHILPPDAEIKNVTSSQPEIKPRFKPEAEIKTFDELFYYADLVEKCIDVLRKVQPALIDENYNYIGHSKGAFCVWIEEMKTQGFIKHFSDRGIYAKQLCTKIKRFSIDESMFGKYQTRAEKKYRTDFKTLLSQIKLSQSSQKGKLRKL